MERQKQFLIRFAYIGSFAALAWLGVRYVLVWLLPFLLALGLAALVAPPVECVRRKLHLRRGFVAAVFTLVLLAVLIALVATLMTQLARQAMDILRQLPLYLSGLPAMMGAISDRLEDVLVNCPANLRQDVEQFLTQLTPQLSQVASGLSAAGMRATTAVVRSLPEVGLFCATTVLAVFFSVSAYPSITAFVCRQLRPQRQERLRQLKRNLFSTLGKWLKAQTILLTVTFCELLTGLALLRQPYALLLAVLIALIDALPVFGTGTVLLPWAAVLCLAGNIPRALALTVLYAIISVVRSILEPKIMAAQANLPPLAALMAMYVGFRTLGVGGMVLFPLSLLLIKQLHDAGYFHLWK
ncbi:MAG: sporulation integral membrane protein YtvI [Oscillospiraceae bacterium]|nr:sporulation integral membrane protein YtvI [Oscillospiraceae bacterium]